MVSDKELKDFIEYVDSKKHPMLLEMAIELFNRRKYDKEKQYIIEDEDIPYEGWY